ncbi:MAG: hypothetical protein K0V04_42350 [Deltaproteobacteria bacterium]|nr:hypothetical protein [Deltaproteobacteria bacterium]
MSTQALRSTTIRAALLGLVVASAACGEDDAVATPATTTSSGTSGNTTAQPGTSSTAADDTRGASTGPSSSGTTTPSSTSSTTTASTAGETTTTGTTGPVVPPCEAGCEIEFGCSRQWRSEQACIDSCEANLLEAEQFHRACRAAWENLHECLGTLSCEEFTEWFDPMRFPYPCLSEDEVLAFECKGQ